MTRAIADWAWSVRTPDLPDGFAGIRYVSRLDSTQECWALFGGTDVRAIGRTPILPQDPDVRYACERLGLTVH